MSKEEPLPYKIVDLNKVPGVTSRKREQWLSLLKKIPPGKAMVATEHELGVSASSVTTVVNRYMREGLLPKGYRVTRRSKGDTVTVYILNQGTKEAL